MGVVNLDLLTVGTAVAALFILGFVAIFTNRHDRISRYFALFCFINAAWGTANYVSYQIQDPLLALIFLRLILFTAIFQTMSFAALIEAFGSASLPKWFVYGAVPFGFAAAIPALTPIYFIGINIASSSIAPQPIVSPAIGLFAVTAISFVLLGIWSLVRQLRIADGERKEQLRQILLGTALMFSLIICLNFLAPVFFNTTYFIPLGAIFILPFAIMTGYAILNQHLFNIKIAATAVLIFLISIVSFLDIVFSNTLPEVILRTSVFVLVLVFGINLIRGVLREVEQREKIEKLAQELQQTNTRQEWLIHFIGHEVKGFLAKDAGVFAMLSEGDMGALPDALRPLIDRALAQSREGVTAVTDILKASNQKKGTTEYKKESFDFKQLVAEEVEKARPEAEEKGLALSFTADDAGAPYAFVGDRGEIGDHVLRNLIDNAINYTPSGSVAVSLKREGRKMIFAVKDTGIGITEEDKKRLFTEGGHGKDSQRVNTHSTGYGLFIAKNIVIAHGGTIAALSEGAGKGSMFVVEFPTQA